MSDQSWGVRVTLKLFGSFRRHLPPGGEGHACQIEVPRGATPAHVLAHYDIPAEGTVVLVNGVTSALDRPLDEDDVLAAFPALAGG